LAKDDSADCAGNPPGYIRFRRTIRFSSAADSRDHDSNHHGNFFSNTHPNIRRIGLSDAVAKFLTLGDAYSCRNAHGYCYTNATRVDTNQRAHIRRPAVSNENQPCRWNFSNPRTTIYAHLDCVTPYGSKRDPYLYSSTTNSHAYGGAATH
jgi:hypothetical protein